MVARTKWRQFCSTCGNQFHVPNTWAYCSKKCEEERQGLAAIEAREDAISEWLHPLYVERMDIAQKLETAMPWERVDLLAALAANEAKEAAVRESLTHEQPPEAEPKQVRPLLEPTSISFWLPILRREGDKWEASVRRSLQVSIMLGRRLCEARANLPHGEFGRLFAEHENAVEGALQFSARWARQLMVIAANDAIANRKHASDLPADITTVALLARLPASELKAAIERGDVTPDMKRADARDLLPEPEAVAPSEPVDEVAKTHHPIQRALRRFVAARPSEFSDLKARLKAALRAIERELAAEESLGTELMSSVERADMRSWPRSRSRTATATRRTGARSGRRSCSAPATAARAPRGTRTAALRTTVRIRTPARAWC
jgi:hypothetical protein